MIKKPIFGKHTHDEKTCFRCRLHELFDELKKVPENDNKFMLMSLGEACAQLLSQVDEIDMMNFIMFIVMEYKDAKEELVKEGMRETKH
jgi:hypothetical protein